MMMSQQNAVEVSSHVEDGPCLVGFADAPCAICRERMSLSRTWENIKSNETDREAHIYLIVARARTLDSIE